MKAREGGLWLQMRKGEDEIVLTAAGTLGEVAVRGRPPWLGTMLAS